MHNCGEYNKSICMYSVYACELHCSACMCIVLLRVSLCVCGAPGSLCERS